MVVNWMLSFSVTRRLRKRYDSCLHLIYSLCLTFWIIILKMWIAYSPILGLPIAFRVPFNLQGSTGSALVFFHSVISRLLSPAPHPRPLLTLAFFPFLGRTKFFPTPELWDMPFARNVLSLTLHKVSSHLLLISRRNVSSSSPTDHLLSYGLSQSVVMY